MSDLLRRIGYLLLILIVVLDERGMLLRVLSIVSLSTKQSRKISFGIEKSRAAELTFSASVVILKGRVRFE